MTLNITFKGPVLQFLKKKIKSCSSAQPVSYIIQGLLCAFTSNRCTNVEGVVATSVTPVQAVTQCLNTHRGTTGQVFYSIINLSNFIFAEH